MILSVLTVVNDKFQLRHFVVKTNVMFGHLRIEDKRSPLTALPSLD